MNNNSIKFITEEIDSGKRLDSVLSKKNKSSNSVVPEENDRARTSKS